jgi:hypothetical protein
MAGGGTKTEAGKGPVVREDHVFEVLTDGPGIAKIVILMDETLIEPLSFGTADHAYVEGEKRREAPGDWCGIHGTRGWPGSFSHKPGELPLLGGKGNESLPIENKHQSPADHVLGRSVRLGPVPPTAEFLREEEAACAGIPGDNLPHVVYVLPSIKLAAIPDLHHGMV